MLTLMRQDPAFRGLAGKLGPAVVLGLLLRFNPEIAAGLASGDLAHRQGYGHMVMLFALLLVVWLAAANTWTRSSRLAQSLPVATRQLWAARMVSIAVSCLLPVAALAAILAPRLGLEGLSFNWDVLATAARLGVGIVLAAVLFQIPSPGTQRIPGTPEYVIYCVLSGLGVVLVMFVAPTSWVLTVLCAGAAAVIALRLYRRLPHAFTVPNVADDGGEGDGVETERFRKPGAITAWEMGLLVHRALLNHPLAWMLLVGFAFLGFASVQLYAEGRNPLLPAVLATAWTQSVVRLVASRMTCLDPLPISRRALFAHIAGSVAVAVLGGALFAVLDVEAAPGRHVQIRYEGGAVSVPPEYLEIAEVGAMPEVVAAWGERHAPQPMCTLPGGSSVIYNPYEVRPDASARFVELQLARAAEAVHGVPVPLSLRTALGTVDEGVAWAVDNRQDIGYAHGLASDGRSRTAAVAIAVLAAVAVVMVAPFLRQHSASRFRRAFKVLTAAAIVVATLAMIALVATDTAWGDVPLAGVALLSIGVHRFAEWLPLSTPELWFLTAVSWLAAYLVLERHFRHLEAPGPASMERFAQEY